MKILIFCTGIIYAFLLKTCSNSEIESPCSKIAFQINEHYYNYKQTKDTADLIKILHLIDTIEKKCDYQGNFFETKVEAYILLKRYEYAIKLLDTAQKIGKENNYYIYHPFGECYYYQLISILKYNQQKDTLNRNQAIKSLIEYMKVCFLWHDKNRDKITKDSLRTLINHNRTITCSSFHVVDPEYFPALESYYTIRFLLENKDSLINEIKQISIEMDANGEKRDYLLNMLQTGKIEEFYSYTSL
jgi:hypothetical protein